VFNPTFLRFKIYFKNKVENKKFKVQVVVGVDYNVSPTLLRLEKKVKKIIMEKSHIA
jgi:hypothetical protein